MLCREAVMHLSYWAALCEKVPNVLSRCHTKRRTSFGMTLIFQKKKKIQKIRKSRCHAKKKDGRARSSFGMTPTQAIIGTFWCDAAHIEGSPGSIHYHPLSDPSYIKVNL